MNSVVCVLGISYALFLVLGALLFMYLEYEVTESANSTYVDQWRLIKDILSRNLSLANETEQELGLELLEWVKEKCPTAHESIELQLNTSVAERDFDEAFANAESCDDLHMAVTEEIFIYTWTFLDALYFSMTVATTIGYGHIAPSKTGGRVACIIYAVIGIPFTMILLSRSSQFFGEVLYGIFTSKVDKQKQGSKLFIALGTVFYIIIGFIIFIFFPAILFTLIEEWSYFESVYYAFITLTTIGFGDFVTGKTMESPTWLYVYQISVIAWIICGLGYWVMVANFIIRALQSKKLTLIARKATQIVKMVNPSIASQLDPEYLMNNSRASMAFMIQLSNSLAMQAAKDTRIPISTECSKSNTKQHTPENSTMANGELALYGESYDNINSAYTDKAEILIQSSLESNLDAEKDIKSSLENNSEFSQDLLRDENQYPNVQQSYCQNQDNSKTPDSPQDTRDDSTEISTADELLSSTCGSPFPSISSDDFEMTRV